MDALEQIKQLMRGLSNKELDELRQYATLMLSVGGSKAQDYHPQDVTLELVLVVLAEFMRDKGAEFSSPDRLRASLQFKAFEKKMNDGLLNYLQTVTRKNRIALRALLYLAIGLLYDNMVKLGLPISARTMMAQVHRTPAILNQAFPGYANAGLLYLAVREEEKQDT